MPLHEQSLQIKLNLMQTVKSCFDIQVSPEVIVFRRLVIG